MMKFSTLLLFAIAFFAIRVGAQPYYNVSHTTGTVAVGGVNVTVVGSGAAGSSLVCPGHNYALGSGASSYTYTMNTAIAGFRIYSIGLDPGEFMTVQLNGNTNFYDIENANYAPYSTCGFSNPGAVGGALYYGTGIITILQPQITSFKINSNGSAGGSVYMLEILPLTASSSGTICSGSTLNLSSNLSGATYSWVGPNGFNSLVQNPTIPSATTAASGTYTVTATSGLVSATQTVTALVNQSVTPTMTVNASTTSVCSGVGVVNFNAVTTNGGGAPSYQWKVNATNVGTNSTGYTNTTGFTNGDVVSCTMTTSATCATTPTATNNAVMTVTPSVTPSLTISFNPPTNICAGTPINFTANPTNGGAAPTYQWKKNGINVATGSSYNAGTTVANGDIVSCVMTSNAPCATAPTASATTTMTIFPVVAPTVTITSNVGSNTCVGTAVVFSAGTTNGGSSPTYQWTKNGNNIATGSVYNAGTSLINGDVIRCILTSSLPCVSPISANSNIITMTINPVVVPSVSIAVNPGNSICAGTSVTFTATPVNGGSSPSYQWKRNGTNVATGAVYTTSALANNDIISCVMTPNIPCPSVSTVTSNYINMGVNAVLTPTVVVNTPSTSVCNMSPVSFTTTVTASGGNPFYQWKINGNNVGTNISSYTNIGTLQSGDVVSCTMTSNYGCATTTIATGSKTMTVNQLLPTSITIKPSPKDSICVGTAVTFSSIIANGGTTPTYQWKKNGTNVATGASYNAGTTLANGDIITCILTSNVTCPTSANATSNAVSMTVAAFTPSNVLVTSDFGSIGCVGVPVTFTATPVYGGAAPSYQWKKNSINVGLNSNTYVDNTLVTGDAIVCTLTGTAFCPSPATPTSAPLVMTINQPVIPVITISAVPGATICEGSEVTFNSSFTHGGLVPKYQWIKNTQNIQGATGATYTSSALGNSDVIACKLESSLTCAIPVVSNDVTISTVSIKPATAQIYGIPQPDGIMFYANLVNCGTTPGYQWRKNGKDIPGATQTTYLGKNLLETDGISLWMHSTEPCANPEYFTSNALLIAHVTGVSDVNDIIDGIALYPNPNDGIFTLKGNLSAAAEKVSIQVSNAIGQVIYTQEIKPVGNEINHTINLDKNYAAGMYLLHLQVDGKKQVMRFMIK